MLLFSLAFSPALSYSAYFFFRDINYCFLFKKRMPPLTVPYDSDDDADLTPGPDETFSVIEFKRMLTRVKAVLDAGNSTEVNVSQISYLNSQVISKIFLSNSKSIFYPPPYI